MAYIHLHNFNFPPVDISHLIGFLSFRLEFLPSSAPPPRGSTMLTIGSKCEVYMQLEGLVDAIKEIARLEDLIGKKTLQRDKCIKSTEIEGYEEKVCHSYI